MAPARDMVITTTKRTCARLGDTGPVATIDMSRDCRHPAAHVRDRSRPRLSSAHHTSAAQEVAHGIQLESACINGATHPAVACAAMKLCGHAVTSRALGWSRATEHGGQALSPSAHNRAPLFQAAHSTAKARPWCPEKASKRPIAPTSNGCPPMGKKKPPQRKPRAKQVLTQTQSPSVSARRLLPPPVPRPAPLAVMPAMGQDPRPRRRVRCGGQVSRQRSGKVREQLRASHTTSVLAFMGSGATQRRPSMRRGHPCSAHWSSTGKAAHRFRFTPPEQTHRQAVHAINCVPSRHSGQDSA